MHETKSILQCVCVNVALFDLLIQMIKDQPNAQFSSDTEQRKEENKRSILLMESHSFS